MRAGAAEAARRRRCAPAAATPTAARWGHGGAAGAGAEHHADEGDAGLSSGAKDVGARRDRVGGGVDGRRGRPAGPPSTRVVCVAETAQRRLYGAPVVAALWCM